MARRRPGFVADGRSCAGEILFTGTHPGTLKLGDPPGITPTGDRVTSCYGNFWKTNTQGLLADFSAYGVACGLIAQGVMPGVQLPAGIKGQPKYAGSGLVPRAILSKAEIPT